jgi:long-chain acyl-CoA synthetase
VPVTSAAALVDDGLDTLPKLLRRNAQRWGPRPAFRDKELGIWNEYTWADVYGRVRAFALGLLELGLTPGARVAIIGDNEPQWYWAAFAAYAARGVVVGMFTDATAPEIEYVVGHAEASIVIARDQEQVDKLLAVAPRLPMLKKIVWWYPRGMRGYADPFLVSFDEVLALGRERHEREPERFESLVDEGKGEEIANLYYTSGTTGKPKGAMCSHRALIGSTAAVLSLTSIGPPDHILCYLPPAWIGESFFTLIPHLLTGAVLHTLEEPETIMRDIREATPALILGGSRQWEGWVSIVQARIAEAGRLERALYRLLMPVGLAVGRRRMEGRVPTVLQRLLHPIADAIVLRPIRRYLGLTKVKLAGTAGSVLAPQTFEFLHGLGIRLRQMYGSTEGGMMTGHAADDIRWGTVGTPLPGVEVKLAADGEILVRSPYLFSAYWKDAQATTAAFTPDGWWRSSDAGRFDERGHLVYLDRVSELGRLRNGERYAPQQIESGLRFSAYIRDAMAVGGPGRDAVTVIVIVDFANVGKWAERHRVPYTTFTDLSQRPEVGALVRAEIQRLNATLAPATRVRRFVCLHKEFDPDEADLTRTRKLKRSSLLARYADLIEAMYAGAEEFLAQAQVTYQDGRHGVVSTTVRLYSVPDAG